MIVLRLLGRNCPEPTPARAAQVVTGSWTAMAAIRHEARGAAREPGGGMPGCEAQFG